MAVDHLKPNSLSQRVKEEVPLLQDTALVRLLCPWDRGGPASRHPTWEPASGWPRVAKSETPARGKPVAPIEETQRSLGAQKLGHGPHAQKPHQPSSAAPSEKAWVVAISLRVTCLVSVRRSGWERALGAAHPTGPQPTCTIHPWRSGPWDKSGIITPILQAEGEARNGAQVCRWQVSPLRCPARPPFCLAAALAGYFLLLLARH